MIVTVTLNAALDRTLTVPNFQRGQRIGEVRVYDGPHLIARSPLIATRTIAKPGFFSRVGWYAGQTVHHFWSWFS